MPGPPVVLLHGLATSAARTWGDNGWVDLLRDAGREVLALDLMGHGDAPSPHDPRDYDGFEQHVIDALPAGRVDGVGFSLGARTLLTIAVDHPDRFHRIVVAGVGANLFDHDPERGRLIADAIAGTGDLDDPTARYFSQLADAGDIDRLAVAALLRRSGPPFPAERLHRITCPVLVVLGDHDFAGPADPLVEALPDARLVTLRNTDHFATPKAFTFLDAALDFLGAAPT